MKPKYRKDASKALENYKQPKELKTVFAAHNCVASHRGIAVFETDDAKLIHKTLSLLLDFMNFEVTPILPVLPE